MRIKLLHVTGSFHGLDNVQPGQIVEVDDENGARYIRNGLAELADGVEEHAVVDTEVETTVVKPRPRGRPKKQPDWDDEQAPGWKAVESDT